jgi:hypothetical protein
MTAGDFWADDNPIRPWRIESKGSALVEAHQFQLHCSHSIRMQAEKIKISQKQFKLLFGIIKLALDGTTSTGTGLA